MAKKITDITEVNEAIEREEIERPYTLRPLKDGDMFPLLNLLKKVGAVELKTVLQEKLQGRDMSEGFEVIGLDVSLSIAELLFTKLPDLEDDIYEFWSGLSGLTPAAIKDMEFGTLPLMIIDTFKEVKNANFFKVLSLYVK